MIKNIGTPDRILRILLGIAVIVGAFIYTESFWEIVLVLVGILVLLQGVLGWCGLYALLRINTNKGIY